MEIVLFVWNAILTFVAMILNNKQKKTEILLEKLQSRRTEVIEQTYLKLVDFYDYLEFTLSPNSAVTRKDKDEVAKKSADFHTHFKRHKIYFSGQLSEKVEEYWSCLVSNYRIMRGIKSDINNYEKFWNDNEKKQKMFESITVGEGYRLKKEIEDEFRKLIGVT